MFLESETEKWTKKKVIEMGGLFFKFVSPGNDGVPDRIAILPGGRIILVEMKTEKGKTSPVQERQIGRIRGCGCDCRVIHGRKEAEEFIDEIRTARVSEICDKQNTGTSGSRIVP